VSAFFSYGGWWEASKLAGEVRRPSRTLPLVFVTGIGIVTVVYLLASAVFLCVLPPAEAVSPEVSAALLGERLFGPAGGRVLAAAVLLSALGSLAALVLSSPRLYVAMAGDGLFPRRLGAPHRRLGTPVGAIAVQAALACLLATVGTFGDIVAYFVFTTVAFITLSVASIFVLPVAEDSFRAPGRRPAAAIFIAISIVLLVLVAGGRPLAAAAGVAMVALGIPVHALLRRSAAGLRQGRSARRAKE
jgi:APA family basic amino acid/polyamine antiporter